jgi:hypothetical protein
VFTGGGIDALAPNADSGGGYAALSALPVLFGSNNANTNFGPGLLNPQAGTGGLAALANYDALSAIPAYLNLPPNDAPELAAAQQQAPLAAAQQQAPLAAQASIQQPAPTSTSTPTAGSNPVNTFSLPKLQALTPLAPQALTPPAPPQVEPAATPGDNSGPQLNVSRVSEKFTPKGIGDNPLLLGGGGQNAGEGMRGYGSLLKKVGLGGGE